MSLVCPFSEAEVLSLDDLSLAAVCRGLKSEQALMRKN